MESVRAILVWGFLRFGKDQGVPGVFWYCKKTHFFILKQVVTAKRRIAGGEKGREMALRTIVLRRLLSGAKFKDVRITFWREGG